MLQWGAGHADVEAAKADEQRVDGEQQDPPRCARRGRALLRAAAPAGAAQRRCSPPRPTRWRSKQFEVARNRYIIGKISNTALYIAQEEKDEAVLAYVQALRNYWTSYYHLRRVTLYDFEKNQELVDDR